MKPIPTSPPEMPPLLVFGAHPDDIEFACGAVIAKETRNGRNVHFIICSRGEAGSHGTPDQRVTEAEKAASLLGATIEFVDLDGDAHLEIKAAHAIKLAGAIRRFKPGLVLAPSLVENQHPDHAVLGLVSTKVPALESVDELCRRIDEAARYLPLDQLAISPQCGFASDAVGNLISEDDQRRKLERVVEVARRVWG